MLLKIETKKEINLRLIEAANACLARHEIRRVRVLLNWIRRLKSDEFPANNRDSLCLYYSKKWK